MELKQMIKKILDMLGKYKFVALVLFVGLVLMLLPDSKKTETVARDVPSQLTGPNLEESLSEILSLVKGAGEVKVLLNEAQGEQTVYQVDTDRTGSGTDGTERKQTVTLTDADRNAYGLVQQTNPPVYLGAVVLCHGADDPSVKLSIVDAVSKVTGLNANEICVLKME